ncbi:MOP flippase family protein [Treponema phagedenis]|nr:MOP flippase family protein [Treponema phagedenis]QEK03550.1 MOP flippase family protein [Treponema phagedenis]
MEKKFLSELNKQAVSGMKWMAISTLVLVITQMISTAILVRLLEKSDFGIMAILMVVKGFADLFMDFGITTAILHKQNISKNQYSSLYWFNMLIGFIIYICIYLLTPFIARFYNQKELIKLIPLMCLAIPFSSIGRQQKTFLQKELHFKQIAVTDIVSAFLGLCTAVCLAYNHWGVYALVISNLVRYTAGNIIFFFLGIWRMPIILHLSLVETLPFLKIGGYHTVSQIVNYFTTSFDVLIIGKMLGTDSVGIYNLAKDLVLKPAALIAPITSKVATPIFSKLQNDKEKLKKNFFFVQKLVSNLNGLVYLGLFALANPFVSLYYGNSYHECVHLVQILALYYFLRQYGDSIGMICIAKGRTDIDMWWNLIVVCITPFFVLLGSLYSIQIVTLALLLGQLLLSYPGWYMYTKKLLGIPFLKYYESFFCTVLIFILPIVVSLVLIYFLSFPALFTFLISGFLFTATAFFILWIFERTFIRNLLLTMKGEE